jgi:hypothetical protein
MKIRPVLAIASNFENGNLFWRKVTWIFLLQNRALEVQLQLAIIK